MPLIRIFVATLLGLAAAQPAEAGKARELVPGLGCISTIEPGNPLLSGIHTGDLPAHVLLKRCRGLWMSLSLKDGEQRTIMLQERFIPTYKARNKPFAIPDARVAIDAGNIREAWLSRPTRRYDHRLLGDEIEGGGLQVALPEGREIELLLDDTSVFEDRMARIVDLDGDGASEIVTVRSRPDSGAALAVYGLAGEAIVPVAETVPAGKGSWLAVAAAADFDGDGRIELAYVENPHAAGGGTLKLVRLEREGNGRVLKEVATLQGFSSHEKGSRELQQAVAVDWNGDGHPDLVLPGPDRKTLRAAGFVDGKLQLIDETPIPGAIDSPILAADLYGDEKPSALLVTKDGRLLAFSPQDK